eukprot:8930519-Karenia_brevis.AAC.1
MDEATREAFRAKSLDWIGINPTLVNAQIDSGYDLTFADDDEPDNQQLLIDHCDFWGSTTAGAYDFATMGQSFPWRCVVLQSDTNDEQKQACLRAMQKEDTLVNKMAMNDDCKLQHIPHVKWQAYQELMAVHRGYAWKSCSATMKVVDAWFPLVMHTEDVEKGYCDLRHAEQQHKKSINTSFSNMQA